MNSILPAGGSKSALARAAFAAVWSLAFADAQPADLVVKNARIYTASPAMRRAGAIAVRGGRIVALSEIPAARTVDAGGAAMIPGFIDAHGHMRGLGDSLEMIDLREARSPREVAGQVKSAAAKLPPGHWIRGRGWDQTRWPGGEFPTDNPLNAAAPDHPVYLTRVDGHAAWVNGRALESAGVNAGTADPPGGRIHRDAAGRPTGILIDRAMGLVSSRIPPPDLAQVKRQIERAARECARLGLTGVHDAGAGELDIAAYRELIADNRLPVRVYAMLRGGREFLEESFAAGPKTGEFLTIRSVKLVADGALGSRGAALKAPYSDEPSNSGLLIMSESEIEGIARKAAAAGFQVNTHAIGDRANRVVLDAYAAVLGGPNDRRFRVEHAQIVDPADFALFRKYGIIASMQAAHATSDMRWAGQRVGPARIEGAYAWRKFLALGVRVANGSDFPVENANPMWGFYASITRQDHAGNPPGGWRPGERMSRDEALRSWTLDAAYAAFEEKDKGSLEPGKLADFLILDTDIMTAEPKAILNAKVLMTVLGGRIVHEAN
jgi:hypothetical protein